MGQAAAIVLNDGTATPVAVTFSPEEVAPGKCVFVDRRKTIRNQQPSFEILFKRPVNGRQTYRTTLNFEYPIVQAVGGLDTVTGVARFKDGDWIIPDFMPEIDRKHMRAFVANALDAALIKGYIEAYDPMF